MKPRFQLLTTVLIASFLFLALTVSSQAKGADETAPITDQLTLVELAKVMTGGEVIKTRNIKGSRWPEVISYLFIQAPLDWVLSLNFNYDEHSKIVSSLK